MMNKEQKQSYITEMTSKFENSKAIMITHYQGLTMSQLDELRSKMREHGIVFKITKNRITKLALDEARANIVGILSASASKIVSILLARSEKMSSLPPENSETQPKE